MLTRYIIDPYIASALVSNLIEGVIRIVIFIVYLRLISLMSDIKRVFAYHVAELHLHELRPALEEIQTEDEGPVARSLRRAFAALDHSHEGEK